MRKIIDDNGRLFGKISVIDVMAVALAAVLIFVAVTNYDITSGLTTGTETALYTVTIKDIRLQNAELIRAGDTVWSYTDARVGVVREVIITPAEQRVTLIDGTIVVGSIEYKYDVDVIIEAQYTDSGGRMFIDRVFDLAVNRHDRFRTKYQIFSGTITAIELI